MFITNDNLNSKIREERPAIEIVVKKSNSEKYFFIQVIQWLLLNVLHGLFSIILFFRFYQKMNMKYAVLK